MLMARKEGIAGCETCGLVQRAVPNAEHMICARCGASMHFRKPDSISRTWALLIASYVLIIPANLMPVMDTGSLFGTEKDTIFGGVVYLWASDSEVLAIILFCASIIIPFAKLFSLTFLLISVQIGSTWKPKMRARLYRVVEAIGRWSMIDVYVATMLTALVQFGNLMHIRAGGGAIAFATVVVLTIFAAKSFDPRMIWDAVDRSEQKNLTSRELHA